MQNRLIRAIRTSREEDDRRSSSASPRKATGVLIVVALVVLGVLGAFFVRRMFLVAPVDASVERDSGLARKGSTIQVSVLNASGGQNMARHTMDYLRARGFDVVEIGNAHVREMKSLVIDRANDSVSARKVAFALGIGDSCIRVDVDTMLFLEVHVVLGDDYRQLKPWR
jgi:hypothetical protein